MMNTVNGKTTKEINTICWIRFYYVSIQLTSPKSPRPHPFNAANLNRYGVPGSSEILLNADKSGIFSDVIVPLNIELFQSS